MTTYYCVAASSPGSAASIPCSPDNIGLTTSAALTLSGALITVATFALLMRFVVRFFLNRS